METTPLISEERLIEQLRPSIVTRISVLIFVSYSLMTFGIGIWGLDKCPAQSSQIPILLSIAGAYSVLITTMTIMNRKFSFFWTSLMFIIIILQGSIAVFKIYKPSFDPLAGPAYCNAVVYFYALINLEVIYILLGFFAIFLICSGIYLCIHWNDLEAEMGSLGNNP